jgi:hypothetical protein
MSNRAQRRQKQRGGSVMTGAFRNDGIVPGQLYSFGSEALAPQFQTALLFADYEPLPDGRFEVVVCDQDQSMGLESVATDLVDGFEAAMQMAGQLADRIGLPVQTLHMLAGDPDAFQAEAARLGINVQQ